MAHHPGMFTSAGFKFTATLIVSVLGFLLPLCEPVSALLDVPLAMQVPQR